MQTFVDSDGKLTITLPPIKKEAQEEDQEEDEEAEEQEEDEKTEEDEAEEEEAEEEDIDDEMKQELDERLHAEPPSKKQFAQLFERNNSNVRKPKSYYGPTSIEPATSTFETTFKFDAQPATFNFGYDPSAFNFTPSFKFEEIKPETKSEPKPVQVATPVAVPRVEVPVVTPVTVPTVITVEVPVVTPVTPVEAPAEAPVPLPTPKAADIVSDDSESDISSDEEECEDKPDLHGDELRNISDMLGSLNLKISALLLHRPQFGAQHAISMLISLGVGYIYGLSTVYRTGSTGSFSNYH